MPATRRRFLGTVTTSALALSGCLGGDGDGATPTGTATDGETDTPESTDDATATDDETDRSGSPVVQGKPHSEHGEILAGPDSMTLYRFDADEQGAGTSACPDIEGCGESWPPLTVDDPDAATGGPDVGATVSTLEREDGTLQVVANGWPLYYFAGDETIGDANGQGVDDAWWVLDSDGAAIRPQAASVAVRTHEEHGDILVDGDGMTLYAFENDEQAAGTSSCTGNCLDAWPPLRSEREPTVGEAVTAEITTFERADGSTQVAANGWPLYAYAEDEEPGDVAGQGVNDAWWVLDPAGEPQRDVDEATATSTANGTTTASGGDSGD